MGGAEGGIRPGLYCGVVAECSSLIVTTENINISQKNIIKPIIATNLANIYV